MEIKPVNRFITPKTTGYAAAGGITLAILSGLSKNKCIRKTHKPISIISAFLTAFHIALIEYNHHKIKNKQM